MAAYDLAGTLSRNLKYFMERPTSLYKNPNALGRAAKVSPNTIWNYLDPTRRTTTAKKPKGDPRLDLLAKLADKLGCEVWELLHPDIQRSIRERLTYQHITAMQAAEEHPRPPIPGYPKVTADLPKVRR